MARQAHTNVSTSSLAIAIMTYLVLHPRATDTVEGIARWWVRADGDAVKKALDLLVKRGEVSIRDGRYSRRHGT